MIYLVPVLTILIVYCAISYVIMFLLMSEGLRLSAPDFKWTLLKLIFAPFLMAYILVRRMFP